MLVVASVALAAAWPACGDSNRGGGASATPATQTCATRTVRTGVESCPRGILRLHRDAVARAANAALHSVEETYGGIDTEGARVTSASIDASAGVPGQQIKKPCASFVWKRSVVVDPPFPEMNPSASPSHETVIV